MLGYSECITPATPRGILVIENGDAGLGWSPGGRERVRRVPWGRQGGEGWEEDEEGGNEACWVVWVV